MTDQDHVVPGGGEGAVGLVRDPDWMQVATALQLDRFAEVKIAGLDTSD
jgi:hypothetical protein